MEGWIKLYRQILDNPIICKDKDYLAVWIYLLLNATHKQQKMIFKGQKITLEPGQLITGRKVISKKLKIEETKIQRVLKCFESEHQIEQQTSSQNRLITIVSWDIYQQNAQQNEQQMHNDCTTSAHEQECKNNNINNNINYIYSTKNFLKEAKDIAIKYGCADNQKKEGEDENALCNRES